MRKSRKKAPLSFNPVGKLHKHFGAVAVTGIRITQGGHEVADALNEDGREIVLLTDPTFWAQEKSNDRVPTETGETDKAA
jgi:hypothetical protein